MLTKHHAIAVREEDTVVDSILVLADQHAPSHIDPELDQQIRLEMKRQLLMVLLKEENST